MSTDKTNLAGMSRDEIALELEILDEKPFRAKQLWHWIYYRGETDFDKMTTLAKSLRAKLNDGYEVVTTSRYVPGGGQVGVDLYRRTLSRCANLLLKACFPIRGLKEYTCGYRAYRVSFLQDALAIFGNQFIDLKGMGFTGTVEKMIKARLMRARVGEVPFTLRYDLKPGLSKVATNITTLGYFVLIAKYIVYWGDIGQEWKRKIGERYVRTYDEKGNLRAGPVKVT